MGSSVHLAREHPHHPQLPHISFGKSAGNLTSVTVYLVRLMCEAGNMPLMLQQAKRIMVCLGCMQATGIMAELIMELQVCSLVPRFHAWFHALVFSQ